MILKVSKTFKFFFFIFNQQNEVPHFFGWVQIICEINTNIFMHHRYGQVLTYIDVIGFKENQYYKCSVHWKKILKSARKNLNKQKY